MNIFTNLTQKQLKMIFLIRMWLVFIFGGGFLINIILSILYFDNNEKFWQFIIISLLPLWASFDLISKNKTLLNTFNNAKKD